MKSPCILKSVYYTLCIRAIFEPLLIDYHVIQVKFGDMIHCEVHVIVL